MAFLLYMFLVGVGMLIDLGTSVDFPFWLVFVWCAVSAALTIGAQLAYDSRKENR